MSTIDPMPHLTRTAREQLALSDADRIAAIYGARFVPIRSPGACWIG